jgi:hypothetical protein
MSEPLSFDRDAWLYPYYAALKRDQGFDRLAPVFQANALADAIQADYPTQAAEIRDWTHATAVAMLTWLDTDADIRLARQSWRTVMGHPPPAMAQVDQQRAAEFFNEAQALRERDGGRLWGMSTCAPMMPPTAHSQA